MKTEKSVQYGIHGLLLPVLGENIDKLLLSRDLSNRRIIFYGITEIHNYAIRLLREKGVKEEAVIDRNPFLRKGFVEEGTTLRYADEFLSHKDESCLFVIGGNHYKQMEKKLVAAGYNVEENIVRLFDPTECLKEAKEGLSSPVSQKEEKEIQLEALIYLKQVCNKVGVDYYLAYGTLIGAVRHKGFIPWDNDVDVMINAADLQKVANYINTENGRYYFAFPGGDNKWPYMNSLLIDKRTIAVTIDFPFEVYTGAGLDVFSLVKMGDNKEEVCEFRDKCLAFERERRKRFVESNKDLMNVEGIFNYFKNNQKEYVGCVFGSIYDSIYKAAWYDGTSSVEFENSNFSAPVDYDSVLRTDYGEYMVLPPESERNCDHHIINSFWR